MVAQKGLDPSLNIPRAGKDEERQMSPGIRLPTGQGRVYDR